MKDESFFEHVWEVCRQIPPGRVTSYGAIAKVLGKPNWSRMVGYAMGACGRATEPVPFYRVVNSSGQLTGHEGAADRRQKFLEEEGVEIVNHKIKNFKKIFWDPGKELEY
ncbi:MGMT family protein [Mucilaginibacter sp. RS28]|uniref:MGMT family protein n=1 Tax=Mucilaginibacter straminoryzae TaxID=2932774 RepID=A0A9X1X4N9_9SPHI|nr:MGMT family protein [Mucilaginibacter straminoryzae]MCJ8210486.1 MGMT family protein [Mucilaginibacter straminoryzae]